MATVTRTITDALGVFAAVQFSDVTPFTVLAVEVENSGVYPAIFTITLQGRQQLSETLPPGTPLTTVDVSGQQVAMIPNARAAGGFQLPANVTVRIG